MKIAVFLLVVLVLIVGGLLVAIFWEQPDTMGSNAPSLPPGTPEPPPGPVYEGGLEAAGALSPPSSQEQSGAPEAGPGSSQSAPPAESPASGQTSDPAEPPAESPSPSPGPASTETQEQLDDRRSIMLMQAEELYIAGRYKEALELLRRDETLFNGDTARLESEILAAMKP